MQIVITGGNNCRYCKMAVQLLENRGIPFEYLNVHEDPEALRTLKEAGHRTIPQVTIDNKHIGGWTELHAYMQDLNKVTGA